MASRTTPPVVEWLEPDAVIAALSAFVNTEIMARGRAVRPDDDLDAAGVDSMAFLKILLFVETRFGFWMPDEDLVEANIGCLRALANYIWRRRRSHP
ncbi:MAG: acyl carrier protein [Candidatus Rokubacteria bacterium]|nr:acyl carrier protein [Candidatus Rokubacteria bacterium]